MNFICAAALLHDLRHVAAGEIFFAADVGTGDELDALGRSRSTRRCTTPLSSFMFGMPYIKQAADAVGPLVDGDRVARPC